MQKIASRVLAVFVALAVTFSGSAIVGAPAQAASKAVSVKGPAGQTLTASVVKNLPTDKPTKITVTGKGYSEKVGIYATFCVMPAKGKKPELCGPFDITGQNSQAVWISSNPPAYALLLVTRFSKGGKFKVDVSVSSKIDDYDCTKVKCAIVTRADHTQPDYRKADVIIPVTFK
jgi:hypothetical protein